jgi:coronin-7
MAWSPNGTLLATVARNHAIYIFNPRSSLSPVVKVGGPEGSRGARVVWLSDMVIAVSGFDRYC